MTCFPFDKFNLIAFSIGTAGWTKASTGFTFMNTIRNIKALLFLKTRKIEFI